MYSNSSNSDENPKWEPDALVSVVFDKGNIRILNGYRPQYCVSQSYQTSTIHWFIDKGFAVSGVAENAFVKFITPDAYSGCIERGQTIEIREGSRVVGKATIIEIYNSKLQRQS